MAVRPRIFKIALGAGAAFVAVALLWTWLAVPALVKYPTDLDVTPRYEGTFTLFVDPETAAPLASPQELPLSIERHLEALGDEGGASTVLVKETITQNAGELLSATTESVYAMDRRSVKNVADDRAYAFSPANAVNRSGVYRLQLPMGTDRDETYQVYKNEIGSAYELVPDTADPTGVVEGLDVSYFLASVENAELDPAYLAALRSIVPLPTEMPIEALKPQLAAAGIDFDATLAGVLAVMSPEDQAAMTEALAAPVGLRYVTSFDGRVAVEPRTGTEVQIVGINEAYAVQPELTNFDTLQGLLTKYLSEPAVQAAVPALTTIASAPAIPLFEFAYAQTPASVAAIAGEAKDMRSQIILAERWVPLGLGVAGALGLLLAAGIWMRSARLRVPVPAGRRSRPKHA